MVEFKRVLIANRGAIATRIIRTLDVMGIESIAVYAKSDQDSLHVQRATKSVSLGDGFPADTYLNMDKLIAIAKQMQCQAMHPGYGFLSENTEFVDRCEREGIVFIGPTSKQIEQFGQKHIARELAQAAGVPLPPGSGLLLDVDAAIAHSRRIGFPVMLKSTAGGGGIGMQLCVDEQALIEAFSSVKRLGKTNFGNDAVFVEKAINRARHIEVQVFGDGKGSAVSLGERDCSAQRRNQKVVEECPAPNLPEDCRDQLHQIAARLLASVNYRNAGTVEFILDADTNEYYFLEVNTRLQVEHGVTELVYGIDLVEWMVRQAEDRLASLESLKADLQPSGHAIQVRLYAEDPYRNFQPCAGPLTSVHFPVHEGLRVDHWIESGITISADFDPMLGKLIVHDNSRKLALSKLQHALSEVELYGSATNLQYLQALSVDATLAQGQMTTRYLDHFVFEPTRVDVVRGGTMTTIQDLPGRVGYWSVGIPPSGPFDSLSFQIGNRLLGNDCSAAGLEITMQGPALCFSCTTELVITGASALVTIDDNPVECWSPIRIEAGQTLDIGRLEGPGARCYLCVLGGIACPAYLGSRSTFTLGLFGGHNGSALKAGDVLELNRTEPRSLPTNDTLALSSHAERCLPMDCRPTFEKEWTLRVIYGPHGAPEYFTPDDISMIFETAWQVHYNSSRTGVRLIGPAPQWARSDGGEAGLHPSNIHDNAYAFGSIDFTGDMPVILGPDGPSLGGFVCPATVINADLWMVGQLRAGDTVRFAATSIDEAVQIDRHQQQHIDELGITTREENTPEPITATGTRSTGNQARQPATDASPIVASRESGKTRAVYRVAGERFLLIEYGDPTLDLVSRFRVHALMQWLEENTMQGIIELTPGIRSLQVHYNCHKVSLGGLISHLLEAEEMLDASVESASVPSRIVHLPLSWDDEACRLAIEKYDQSVRKDAPWYPSNLEFIRRINGLSSIEEVKQIVFSASYLVMGLGDVYLGAPVATPVNPAHRLVTTKYNPARTWTAENSVGIGGSYLCVYGMEGPGGYQFVGRTLQMWNRYKQTTEFSKPWLLRFFDQIKFYEVSHDELLQIRQDFIHGRYPLKIEQTQFSLAQCHKQGQEQETAIDTFQQQREEAFARELADWRKSGQFNIDTQEPEPAHVEADWPAHCVVVESPVSGSVWQSCVEPGDIVEHGQTLQIVESMKMEIMITSPARLCVRQLLFAADQRVSAGQPLIVLEEIQ
ncbi:MAG: urea carboxylase [Granulosicoccus sp.]